jgi:hypothetical protein
LYKHDPSERVDPKDLQKLFSPNYGVSFKSTRDLEAGTEVFIIHGPALHHRYNVKIDDGIEYEGDGEAHDIYDLPNEKEKRLSDLHNRRDTEEILRKLRSFNMKSNNDNKQGTAYEDDMDYDKESEGAEYEDDSEYGESYDEEDLDDDEYDEYIREMDAIKGMDWLEGNGMCVDHLRWGRSIIPDAGRGAFAKRLTTKGSVIDPATLLTIKRSDLDILESARKKGQYRTYLNQDKVVEQELLLNYCFGHKDAPLLLLPYTPGMWRALSNPA